MAGELEANRRLHFGLLDSPVHPHMVRLIRLLWDSTEAYRALHYNSPKERREAALAHHRILEAVRRSDADAPV